MKRVPVMHMSVLLATILGCGSDPIAPGPADGGDASIPDAASDASTDSGADAESDAAESGCSSADSGTVVAQSCVPGGAGLTTCGSGSESCCTSLPVAGGTYDRTYLNNGSGATGQADPATVSSFRLDKYEVTVGRFRQFVAALSSPDGGTGWRPPGGSGKHTHLNCGQGLENSGSPGTYEPGWATSDDDNIAPTNTNLACEASYATWTDTATSQEELPINCVNWYESAAFCIWDGGFLPSEAEWEYAAAGGSQERLYPWGTTAPGTGSQYAIYGCYYPDSSGSCSNVANLAPVGTPTSGAGLWGQLDLAGNVYEWNLDLYAGYVTPCTDCADLATVSARVVRGGDFLVTADFVLPPGRDDRAPTNRLHNLGFRCARTP